MNTEILPQKRMGYDEFHTDIVNLLPTPCFVLGTDAPVFTIIEANEAFRSLCEFENHLINGRSFDSFTNFTDLDKNSWAYLIEKVVQERLPVKIPVVRYIKKCPLDNIVTTPIYLLGSIAPLLSSDGAVSQVVCSFTDVTELKSVWQSERDIPVDRGMKLLEETQRIAKIGSWEANLINNTIMWSDLTKEIYEAPLNFAPSFEDVLGFFKKKQTVKYFSAWLRKRWKTAIYLIPKC